MWTPQRDDGYAPNDSGDAAASLYDLLLETGVLPQPPRALLGGAHGEAPGRLAFIEAQMHVVRGRDAVAFAMRNQELAFLANTIAAGCSIQSRPFTLQEASDAAVAVCNLGLQNWPSRWLPTGATSRASSRHSGTALPDDLLVRQDLIGVFQAGWTVLYEEVCMYAAKQTIDVLSHLRCTDREIQSGLKALRVGLTAQWRAGTPWRSRDALDVIAILDTPAWATLLGLIDECPVAHAALAASRQSSRIRSVSPSAFEFISENGQIEAVREFMRTLPETLRE